MDDNDEVSQEAESSGSLEMKKDKHITEKDIEEAMVKNYSSCENLYADIALNLANKFNIFGCQDNNVVSDFVSQNATQENLDTEKRWLEIMEDAEQSVGSQIDEEDDEDESEDNREVMLYDKTEANSVNAVEGSVTVKDLLTENADEENAGQLNDKQRMAFTILKNYLHELVPGQEVKPLLMVIYGAGRTGETKTLHLLASHLRKEGANHQTIAIHVMNLYDHHRFIISICEDCHIQCSCLQRRNYSSFLGRNYNLSNPKK